MLCYYEKVSAIIKRRYSYTSGTYFIRYLNFFHLITIITTAKNKIVNIITVTDEEIAAAIVVGFNPSAPAC